jgi:hypothetical protein
MDAIRIPVIVGEDRRLVIDLPAEVPVGPAELVIRPLEQPQSNDVPQNPAREAARAKLLAAGVLATDLGIPDDIQPLSEQELDRLGRLLAGGRSTLDMINEDRGTY